MTECTGTELDTLLNHAGIFGTHPGMSCYTKVRGGREKNVTPGYIYVTQSGNFWLYCQRHFSSYSTKGEPTGPELGGKSPGRIILRVTAIKSSVAITHRASSAPSKSETQTVCAIKRVNAFRFPSIVTATSTVDGSNRHTHTSHAVMTLTGSFECRHCAYTTLHYLAHLQ